MYFILFITIYCIDTTKDMCLEILLNECVDTHMNSRIPNNDHQSHEYYIFIIYLFNFILFFPINLSIWPFVLIVCVTHVLAIV